MAAAVDTKVDRVAAEAEAGSAAVDKRVEFAGETELQRR